MSGFETILVALIVMTVVFSVLCILWGIIRVFSSIIKGIEANRSILGNTDR